MASHDVHRNHLIDPAQNSYDSKAGEGTSLVAERELDSLNSSKYREIPPNTFHVDNHHSRPPPVSTGLGLHFPRVNHVLRYLLVVLAIGLPLAIPVMACSRYAVILDDNVAFSKQTQNLVYYIFLWLLITWLAACASNVLIRCFPYVFRFVAGYVNPAHRKYWRVFRVMKNPVTFLGTIVASYVSFTYLINLNPYLVADYNKDLSQENWDDALDGILFVCTLWIAIYFAEKMLILYIAIHYHYRSDLSRIERSKRMQSALGTLYEASLYLYTAYHEPFEVEDAAIRHFTSLDENNPRHGAGQFLLQLGLVADKMSDVLGNLVNSDDRSHWFKPDSPYAIVGHAIEHPRSAAALATRIWHSLVAEGNDVLTANDIAEVLGPHRREEAEACFKVLDENENGDIRLEEIVMTVVETGRVRHAIYQGMSDINHALNTFDWIAILVIAVVMVFFILVVYVPTISAIKDTAGFATLGVGFAIGRTIHEFLSGCIFLFFKHAYDIGDRVEIYNLAATSSVSVVVERISVLYTVFKRIDNGKELQISNDRLNLKRIENVTRSGPNKEVLSVFVEFTTTFKDIQYLKSELQTFLTHRENSRDYLPKLNLRVASIYEMNKMEIKCSFWHKSNWSNEELRAARSSKFLCALVAAIRKKPIVRLAALGSERKPTFTVMMSKDAKKSSPIEKHLGSSQPRTPTAEPAGAHADIDLTFKVEESLREEQERAAEAEKKAAKEAADREAMEAEDAAYVNISSVPVIPGINPENGRTTGGDFDAYPFINRGSRGLRKKVVGMERSLYYSA